MDDRFFSISKRLLLAGIFMGPLLAANQASAAIALTDPMLVPTDDRVAQTAGEPCFIGDSSCNNDSPTSYTNIGDHINGSDSAWNLSSPDYLVSEVREKIGNYFYIAIDVNEAAGASDNEYLDYLELWKGTHSGLESRNTLLYEYKPDSPFQLGNNPGLSNGTGWSDYYFTTLIDISSLLDEDYIHFDAAMSGITNGQEQLFVVPASVPVPAAAWLFGSGLIGLAGVARRRKAA
jgi:hypothetical protein